MEIYFSHTQTQISFCAGGDVILGTSSSLSNLTKLDLQNNNLGIKGAESIVTSSNLSNLTKLNLCKNRIDEKGVKSIQILSTLHHLIELSFTMRWILTIHVDCPTIW